jgi:anti-sigma factor RsiW
MTERVLAEISMNHHKRLEVEVASDQYQVVQAGLGQLDFPILPTRKELLKNYALVGGRYCSVQGGLAAQLKVRDRVSGELLTLYVTHLTDELERIDPLDANFDGVHIRLWQENGRFFALARDRSE